MNTYTINLVKKTFLWTIGHTEFDGKMWFYPDGQSQTQQSTQHLKDIRK